MTIIYLGSTLDDLPGPMGRTTTSTFFDSAYQTEALAADMEGVVPLHIVLPATVTGDLWLHYRLFHNRNSATGMGNADGSQLSVYNASGQLLAAIDMTDGVTRAVAYGDTTVTSGGSFTWATLGAPTYTFDVRVAVSSSNIVVDYYVNGSLVATATAANTTGNKAKPNTVVLDNADIQGTNGSSAGNGISEVIITDGESTVGWRLATLKPDGAGNYTQWIGDWTHVTNALDGLFISAADTGIRESWTLANYGGPTTPASIRGVFTTFFGDKGVGGPQNFASFLRIGGADYEAASQSPLPGFQYIFEWANDPSTSNPWNTTAFNALEAGIRALT